MKPSLLRLVALLALAVPIALTAIAGGSSPAFGALALASAAAGFAMLLAGPVFRVILSALIALLGTCVVLVAVLDPELAGPVVIAIVGGALQMLAAGWVATTVRHWPATTSRYSRSRLEGDPASDWDALSAGDDPTDSAR
ncbi:MAG: Trp biosynthesis-associated membrane protein [Pseudolysinimonas sp.]|uniref:Trp biosynthesis-associated membrane protein n=1 Tax=Pseudolysinimonas sp. TaxID=2680009 RepID=UPI003C74A983